MTAWIRTLTLEGIHVRLYKIRVRNTGWSQEAISGEKIAGKIATGLPPPVIKTAASAVAAKVAARKTAPAKAVKTAVSAAVKVARVAADSVQMRRIKMAGSDGGNMAKKDRTGSIFYLSRSRRWSRNIYVAFKFLNILVSWCHGSKSRCWNIGTNRIDAKYWFRTFLRNLFCCTMFTPFLVLQRHYVKIDCTLWLP